MGVDVELYAENRNNLSQEDLDRVNEYISPSDDGWERFEIVEREIELESEKIKKEFIYFKTLSRYYGVGYERGNWTELTGIINILRQLSGGLVWYFPDHSRFREIYNKPFTREDQKELDKHFAEVQERPYREKFEEIEK